MRRSRTRDVLNAVGQQRTPEPDATFVRELQERLAGGPTAAYPLPRVRRRIAPPAAAVAAAAAVVAVTLVGLGHTGSPDRVTTEPHPGVTSTTVEPPSTTVTTLVALPSVTTSTSTPTTAPTAPTVPTATSVPRSESTTTVVEPTTTTLPHESTTSTTSPTTSPDLHIACTTVPSTITCHWDPSTDPRFTSYRLVRRTADGPETLVYEGTNTTASETGRNGARLYYIVTAQAADGTVLGRSVTFANCC